MDNEMISYLKKKGWVIPYLEKYTTLSFLDILSFSECKKSINFTVVNGLKHAYPGLFKDIEDFCKYKNISVIAYFRDDSFPVKVSLTFLFPKFFEFKMGYYNFFEKLFLMLPVSLFRKLNKYVFKSEPLFLKNNIRINSSSQSLYKFVSLDVKKNSFSDFLFWDESSNFKNLSELKGLVCENKETEFSFLTKIVMNFYNRGGYTGKVHFISCLPTIKERSYQFDFPLEPIKKLKKVFKEYKGFMKELFEKDIAFCFELISQLRENCRMSLKFVEVPFEFANTLQTLLLNFENKKIEEYIINPFYKFNMINFYNFLISKFRYPRKPYKSISRMRKYFEEVVWREMVLRKIKI